MSKVVYCPYYEGEREKYVACEDGRRHFKYPDDKKNYIKKYCSGNWEQCEKVKRLNAIYEKQMTDEEREKALLENKLRTYEKELIRVRMQDEKREKQLDNAARSTISSMKNEKGLILRDNMILGAKVKSLTNLAGMLLHSTGTTTVSLSQVSRFSAEYVTKYKVDDNGVITVMCEKRPADEQK